MSRVATWQPIAFSVFTLIWMPTGSGAAQASWSEYKPGSIAAVMAEEREDVLRRINESSAGSATISAEPYPTRAIVQYLDSTRPTSNRHRDLIEHWVKAFGHPAHWPQLFETEVLFREDTLELWLPVQSPLIPAFKDELRRGDRIALWTKYVGAEGHHGNPTIDWLFVVNAWRAVVAAKRSEMPDERDMSHHWAVIVLDRHNRIDLDTAYVVSTKGGRRAWIRWSRTPRPADSTQFQVIKWELACQRGTGRVWSTERYDEATRAWRITSDSAPPELPLLAIGPWIEAGRIICRF